MWRAVLWGMEQGLAPDADLFELCIGALAHMPRRHQWAANILKYDMLVRAPAVITGAHTWVHQAWHGSDWRRVQWPSATSPCA